MASERFMIGLFSHEDNLLGAVRALREKKLEITDALTPFQCMV